MLRAALLIICSAVLLKALSSGFSRVQRGLVALGSCPGRYLLLVHPFDTVGLALLPIFPFTGWFGNFQVRFSHYAKQGSTILSSVLIWTGTPIFWIADVQALKAVTSDRFTFMKDLGNYDRVNIYGKSVVTTEGNEWRRHVAVAGPAFSEANYMLTWKETLRIVNEWFAEDLHSEPGKGHAEAGAVQANVVQSMTQATLHIISSAGFGFRAPWAAFGADSKASEFQSHPNEKHDEAKYGVFPFSTALQLTLNKLFYNVLIPDSFQRFALRRLRIPFLSRELSTMKRAFASLEVHMTRLVDASREDGAHEHEHSGNGHAGEREEYAEADLLRRLVQANDIARDAALESGASAKKALTDGELFSNIFIFLLAGHETSAHTLAYAILLMALYPGIQAKLREESLRVWPTLDDISSSTFKRDFDQFEYTLAFFRETLRCFPTEPRLVKLVTQDTVLHATRFKPAPRTEVSTPTESCDGNEMHVQFKRDEKQEEKFAVSLPKDSLVIMDIWGLHMNPLVWGPDAHIFRPERFIDTADYKWPRDGFLAFSAGARGCIGLRFAYAESVCILASLVRRFEVLPAAGQERSKFASFEDMKRHMLKTWPELTITPVNGLVRLRPFESHDS